MSAGNVRELHAPNHADIARMLRYWAAELDAGRFPPPRACLLVCLPPDNGFPFALSAGDVLGPLEEAGLLHTMACAAVQPAPSPEG